MNKKILSLEEAFKELNKKSTKHKLINEAVKKLSVADEYELVDEVEAILKEYEKNNADAWKGDAWTVSNKIQKVLKNTGLELASQEYIEDDILELAFIYIDDFKTFGITVQTKDVINSLGIIDSHDVIDYLDDLDEYDDDEDYDIEEDFEELNKKPIDEYIERKVNAAPSWEAMNDYFGLGLQESMDVIGYAVEEYFEDMSQRNYRGLTAEGRLTELLDEVFSYFYHDNEEDLLEYVKEDAEGCDINDEEYGDAIPSDSPRYIDLNNKEVLRKLAAVRLRAEYTIIYQPTHNWLYHYYKKIKETDENERIIKQVFKKCKEAHTLTGSKVKDIAERSKELTLFYHQ